MAKFRVVGISFDHIHMGDLLREVFNHPDAEIAGIYDPDRARMQGAIDNFDIPADRVFTDLDACLVAAKADLAIICARTGEHANVVEKVARHGVNVLVEKPFATSVADARRMIAAVEKSGKRLAVNWPLAWYPSHNTAKRLVSEGRIGRLIEVHFYDGNRGPLFHLADKVEVSPEEVERQKPGSWWYRKAFGGGSLLDYLGYGVTLGTWFYDGAEPIEVTSVVDETPGIEVDQHSITVCRYAHGLSKFETRWGTLTDPWTQQPQPKCGFVLVGSDGSISSYDYDDHVTLQTRADTNHVKVPVDKLPEGRRAPVEYVLARLADGAPVTGPLDPAFCLTGQRIIDSAVLAATEKRTVPLDQMTDTPDTDTYALKSAAVAEVTAPDLPYRPPMPRAYRPRIALVGAGGIAAAHLEAYRDAGFDVAVIASRTMKSAVARRDQFFPSAEATDDVERTLLRDDIEIVDMTPHPDQRLPLIEKALKAGKHVLSQKPFVLDLDAGQRLVDLAGERGRVLAVNQNGRFAPHLSWMREAVRAGLVGDLQSVHVSIHWDHNWIGGTVFEDLHELILYDFAIHWFDFLTSLIGGRATSVYATTARGAGQRVRPPLLAQAMVEFDGGQAALLFDGTTRFGPEDATFITGAKGTLASRGPDLGNQVVTLTTEAGRATPALTGTWFKEGFRGTMGALLRAVEDGTQPLNSAASSLEALALDFAAIASTRTGRPVAPGSVRSLAAARSA